MRMFVQCATAKKNLHSFIFSTLTRFVETDDSVRDAAASHYIPPPAPSAEYCRTQPAAPQAP